MTQSNTLKGQESWLLVGRILIALLFLIFGAQKLLDFHGTAQYIAHVGAPLPHLAAVVAVIMETAAPAAIILGIATRPVSLLLALYTLGAALIAHHFWTMTGMPRYLNAINFYKNISIVGGFFLLYVTGAGRYSLDNKFGIGRDRDVAGRVA